MNVRRCKFVLLLLGCATLGFAAQSPAPATYVGNAACARCHADIARTYAQTPMARTSGAVNGDITAVAFTHQPSGIRYRLQRTHAEAVLHYEGDQFKGRQPLPYFIGSNAAGRSFLFSLDRYLFEAPVTFYAQAKRWDVSPGYEHDRTLRMNRPVDANCLFCHASQTQPIYGAENRFAEPPFKHDGISCERCHGPASWHVEGKAALVNPAKLDAARRDAICTQCHLSGVARIELPGKSLAQFRPGDKLADFVSYFVLSRATQSGLKVNSHVENLAASVCQQKSGARMSCLSCHDPHVAPPPAERAAYYRNRCLQCHQVERLPATHHLTSDCTSCHMPRQTTTDGNHGVMTDHSLLRRALTTNSTASDAPHRLQPFPGFTSDERSLGLAYAELALTKSDADAAAEALRLLTNALAQYPNDAAVLTQLGFLHAQRGDLARAARAYELALQANPHRTVALINLGGIYATQGRTDEAVKLWRTALAGNAGLTEASLNLARTYLAQKQNTAARETLEQALRFDPGSVAARRLLHQMKIVR
jgi:predicted CXXCH cytochrome family protein